MNFLREEKLTLHSHYDAPRVDENQNFHLTKHVGFARESKLLLRRRIIKMFHAKLIFLNVESGLCNNAVGHGTRAL